MHRKHCVLLILGILAGILLLTAIGLGIHVVYTLMNSQVFESVSAQEETWSTPTDDYDIRQAERNGEAFIIPYASDGTFTILHLTDPHLRRGPGNGRKQVYRLLGEAFDYRKPDLVVVTGDMVFSFDGIGMLREFAEFMEGQGIYWTYIFGNHDGQYTHDKRQLGEVLREYPHALFSFGPQWVRGESNYVVGLEDADGVIRQALALLDSHDSREYTVDGKKTTGYDYIYPSQIAWYDWVSYGLDKTAGTNVPLYVFLHIPLPEYDILWEAGNATGVKNEKVCSPLENTGLFQAMVEDGDAVAVFCGHDHINDYAGELDGIWLVYGKSASWGSYGKRGHAKGVRFLTLDAKNPWDFSMEALTTEDLHW